MAFEEKIASATNWVSDNVLANKKDLIVCSPLIAWKIALDIVYVVFVVPQYSYMGFTQDFDPIRHVASWLFLLGILPVYLRLMERESGSDIAVLSLCLISLVPGLTICGIGKISWLYALCFFAFWAILLILNEALPHFSHFRGFCCKRYPMVLSALMLLGVSAVVVYVSIKYAGFRLSFEFVEVYSLRAEAEDYEMGSLVTYLFSSCRALIPVALVYFLVRKKWVASSWLLFLTMLAFSVDGMKSVLYATLIAIASYALFRSGRLTSLATALCLVSVVGLMSYSAFDSQFVLSTFIRRVMFLPNYLASSYFEFFSCNEIDYYRQGFVGRLGFDSPYADPIAVIIGDEYLLGSYANSGLLAEAFANLGLFGLAIVPALLVVVLRTLEALMTGLDIRVVFASFVILAYRLTNSFIPTVILTHGLLLVAVFVATLPRQADAGERFMSRIKGYVKRRIKRG